MKTLIIVLCLVVYASCTPENNNSTRNKDWIRFKKQHNKTYKSVTQELTRLSRFLTTKLLIEKHNEQFKAGNVTYRLKLNKFSDMSLKDFNAKRNGYNRTLKVQRGRIAVKKRPHRPGVSLSAAVNWTAVGAVTPVQDQGQCGACWTFAAAGALEGQYFKKTGKLISLSKQNLLDCDITEFGCDGGVTENAFTYVSDNGIASEDSYPYTGVQGDCRADAVPVSGVAFTGFTSIKEGDEAALKQAVATIGPIATAIDANHKSFMNYGGGIWRSSFCDKVNVNHGVLIVGYGTENGLDYWLVKNSWGSGWGNNGYFKVARNRKNMCGIATAASYPTV